MFSTVIGVVQGLWKNKMLMCEGVEWRVDCRNGFKYGLAMPSCGIWDKGDRWGKGIAIRFIQKRQLKKNLSSVNSA